jgi:hypothetical protein
MSNKSIAIIATMGRRYWQEFVPRRRPRSTRSDRAAAEVVTGQVEARLAAMPPCLIGMACVGAHHLGRKLQGLGHDARGADEKGRPRSRELTNPRKPLKIAIRVAGVHGLSANNVSRAG